MVLARRASLRAERPPQKYGGSAGGEDCSNPSTPVRDTLLKFFKTFRHLWDAHAKHSVQPSAMHSNENAKQQVRSTREMNPSFSRGAAKDARATLRYALQTEVAFSWICADGSSKDGRGQTRDISQKGAFVESPSYPPKGASVKMSIRLPATLNTSKSLRMEAQGRVVRVEPGCEPRGPTVCGFAVSTEQVSLCPS